MTDLTARRTGLWEVPLWEIDLRPVLDALPSLLDDGLEHLERSPAQGFPFRQSAPNLFDCSAAWTEISGVLRNIAASIIEANCPKPSLFSIAHARGWLVEITSAEDHGRQDDLLDLLHTHVPAVLSSVLYLRLPPEVEGTDLAGTTFRSATPALTRQFHASANHRHRACTGHVVFFPSAIEHAPTRTPSHVRFGPSRVVAAADFFHDGS